jgi:hypothetical protein
LIIKRGTKLHINMGNFESVELWAEVEFEVPDDVPSGGMSESQATLDAYLANDLREAIECSGLDANSSFAHHWKST